MVLRREYYDGLYRLVTAFIAEIVAVIDPRLVGSREEDTLATKSKSIGRLVDTEKVRGRQSD